MAGRYKYSQFEDRLDVVLDAVDLASHVRVCWVLSQLQVVCDSPYLDRRVFRVPEGVGLDVLAVLDEPEFWESPSRQFVRRD